MIKNRSTEAQVAYFFRFFNAKVDQSLDEEDEEEEDLLCFFCSIGKCSALLDGRQNPPAE